MLGFWDDRGEAADAGGCDAREGSSAGRETNARVEMLSVSTRFRLVFTGESSVNGIWACHRKRVQDRRGSCIILFVISSPPPPPFLLMVCASPSMRLMGSCFFTMLNKLAGSDHTQGWVSASAAFTCVDDAYLLRRPIKQIAATKEYVLVLTKT